jgi:hypothetical protein
VSRDEYFFEGLKIQISTFCIWADGVSIFLLLVMEKMEDKVLTCFFINAYPVLILKILPVTLFKELVAEFSNTLVTEKSCSVTRM